MKANVTVPMVLSWNFDAVQRVLTAMTMASTLMKAIVSGVQQRVEHSVDFFDSSAATYARNRAAFEQQIGLREGDEFSAAARKAEDYFRQIERNAARIRTAAEKAASLPWDLSIAPDGAVRSGKADNDIMQEYGAEFGLQALAMKYEAIYELEYEIRTALAEIEAAESGSLR
ncbi:hypothetical protein [Nocardia iowensis]|uniref:Uncharacterized protein n=1 Tax=Nocardia iowensis TaxID=204891 RepID=A0ABX8RYJ7_NOCIO|nr:hypothetical protein [Nocardia iowensis]QXN94703.1 hypothetical protein KV110_17590 [Nocardia iowensis]